MPHNLMWQSHLIDGHSCKIGQGDVQARNAWPEVSPQAAHEYQTK